MTPSAPCGVARSPLANAAVYSGSAWRFSAAAVWIVRYVEWDAQRPVLKTKLLSDGPVKSLSRFVCSPTLDGLACRVAIIN